MLAASTTSYLHSCGFEQVEGGLAQRLQGQGYRVKYFLDTRPVKYLFSKSYEILIWPDLRKILILKILEVKYCGIRS